jgi:hypothetical protein
MMPIRHLYLVYLHSSKHRTFLNVTLSFSYNKSQRDALFLKFVFDKELYRFRTDLMSIVRSLNTVYTVIGICHDNFVDCQTEFQNCIEHLLALTYQTTPQKEKIVPKPLLFNKRRQKIKDSLNQVHTHKMRNLGNETYIGISLNFVNPLNAELSPICHLLALLGAHHILHVSRIRVNKDSNINFMQ